MLLSKKTDETYRLRQFNENCNLRFPGIAMGINKAKKKEKLPERLQHKIISEYFDIYFKSILYEPQRNGYFLYTGRLIAARYEESIHNHKNNKRYRPASICYAWVERPSKLFCFVNFIKTKGARTRMPVIENFFKKSRDIDLMPNFEQVVKSHNLYLR